MQASGARRKNLVYMESSNSNEDVDDHFMRAPDDNTEECED